MIDFSLILASRNRIKFFHQLIKSILKTTNDLSKVEMILCLDLDEEFIFEYIAILNLLKETKKVIMMKEQPHNLCNEYYNFMARNCTGKYVWTLNDDCILQTKDWDLRFMELLKEYNSPEIFYARIGGPGHAIKYKESPKEFSSGFPIISKGAIDYMGHLFHPDIIGYKADSLTHAIYRRAGAIIDMSEISIKHIKGFHIADDTQKMMRKRGIRGVQKAKLEREVEKLKEAL